jgi:signal transduction histidine kinase
MNAIMGFAELLPDHFHDKSKLSYFSNIINRRCADLLTIINDILDISKIESGQVLILFEPLNLNTLFNELSDLFMTHRAK